MELAENLKEKFDTLAEPAVGSPNYLNFNMKSFS